MSKSITPVSTLLTVIVGIGLGACTPKKDTAVPGTDPVACTEEAKVCDDGSSVGREGPDCEFAACPDDAIPLNDDPPADPPIEEQTEQEPDADAASAEAQ